jgi:hypothetical protein
VVDGRAVDGAVRELVRRWLNHAGVTKFTGPTGWRFQPATIELVSFCSLTSYIAT